MDSDAGDREREESRDPRPSDPRENDPRENDPRQSDQILATTEADARFGQDQAHVNAPITNHRYAPIYLWRILVSATRGSVALSRSRRSLDSIYNTILLCRDGLHVSVYSVLKAFQMKLRCLSPEALAFQLSRNTRRYPH